VQGEVTDTEPLNFFRAPSFVVCLDTSVDRQEDFIRETRYLAELMRRSCEHTSWRVSQLLARLEEGESLNTRSATTQLAEAREEMDQALQLIERIEKLCELELGD
jgi:hypothetical protein